MTRTGLVEAAGGRLGLGVAVDSRVPIREGGGVAVKRALLETRVRTIERRGRTSLVLEDILEEVDGRVEVLCRRRNEFGRKRIGDRVAVESYNASARVARQYHGTHFGMGILMVRTSCR